MDSPLIDPMDEDACDGELVGSLHPDGVAGPACGQRRRPGAHRRHRGPVPGYRCGGCGRVVNARTGTALHGMALVRLHATGDIAARGPRRSSPCP